MTHTNTIFKDNFNKKVLMLIKNINKKVLMFKIYPFC